MAEVLKGYEEPGGEPKPEYAKGKIFSSALYDRLVVVMEEKAKFLSPNGEGLNIQSRLDGNKVLIDVIYLGTELEEEFPAISIKVIALAGEKSLDDVLINKDKNEKQESSDRSQVRRVQRIVEALETRNYEEAHYRNQREAKFKGKDSTKPKHPDAEFRGKIATLERKDKKNNITLKVRITVDERDPSEWGSAPVKLWVEPIIHKSNFENLSQLADLGWQLQGPLGDLIRDAVGQINDKLVRIQ